MCLLSLFLSHAHARASPLCALATVIGKEIFRKIASHDTSKRAAARSSFSQQEFGVCNSFTLGNAALQFLTRLVH
jgi:hypothetical protein